MKFITIGRIGVGRKTFLKTLLKANIRLCKFFTTDPDADPDLFEIINESEIDNFSADGIHLKRQINNHTCFTTKAEIEKSDVISTDISGIAEICNAFPLASFQVVEIFMDKLDRVKRYIAKLPKDKKIGGEQEFNKLCAADDKLYDEFETQMQEGNACSDLDNMLCVHFVTNNGKDTEVGNEMLGFYSHIQNYIKAHERLHHMLSDVLQDEFYSNIYTAKTDENGNLWIEMVYTNGSQFVPVDVFASNIMESEIALGQLTMLWLKCKDINPFL